MDILITSTFFCLIYGYLHLINRHMRLVKSQKKVRVIATVKPKYLIGFAFAIILHISFAFMVFGKIQFILWCCLSILEVLYILFVYVNSGYVYITEENVIFCDGATKLKDYSYRINDDTIELLPCKSPKIIKTFLIENDKELLIDVLKSCNSIE